MSRVEAVYKEYLESCELLESLIWLERKIVEKINNIKQIASKAVQEPKLYVPPLQEQMQPYHLLVATLETGLQEVRLRLMELQSRVPVLKQSLNHAPLTNTETQGMLSDTLYVVGAETPNQVLPPLSVIQHKGKPIVFLYEPNLTNMHVTAHLEPFIHLLIQGVYRTNSLHSLQLHILDTITGAKAFQTPPYTQVLKLKVYEKVERLRELFTEIKENTRLVVESGHESLASLNRNRIQAGDGERKYQIVLVLVPPMEESFSLPDEWWQELHDGVKTGFLPLFFVAAPDWRNAHDHHRLISKLKKHVSASHIYEIDLQRQFCSVAGSQKTLTFSANVWRKLQHGERIQRGLVTEVHFSALSIGSYVQFGQYNEEPILWRVIHIDEQGDPLLLSDRILTLKAFDAKGNVHQDSNRQKYGSNYWADSNIRQWLNSSEQRIEWKQNPPTAKNMWHGHNAYDQEKGFLANENFTPHERELIKPLKHKVLLSEIDRDKKEGGTEKHEYKGDNPATALTNYNRSYYHMLTDQVFCLSIKQLAEYVYARRNILGEEYYKAKPTEIAVTKSTYTSSNLKSGTNWYYWLSSPYAAYSNFVRFVHVGGYVYCNLAYFGHLGVRPALQLNLKSVIFKSGGKGTENQPYVIER